MRVRLAMMLFAASRGTWVRRFVYAFDHCVTAFAGTYFSSGYAFSVSSGMVLKSTSHSAEVGTIHTPASFERFTSAASFFGSTGPLSASSSSP
jgi:hypothetical protein